MLTAPDSLANLNAAPSPAFGVGAGAVDNLQKLFESGEQFAFEDGTLYDFED